MHTMQAYPQVSVSPTLLLKCFLAKRQSLERLVSVQHSACAHKDRYDFMT